MKFIITSENKNQRLDKFLSQKLLNLSRSQIQKQIRQGLVLVNGKIKPVHYFLKQKDGIELRIKNYELRKEKKIKIKIIKETNDYVVVEKPAGLVVHPASGIKEKTLIEYLTEQYPEITKINVPVKSLRDHDVEPRDGNVALHGARPGIVHRLDKETSGLMVVARRQKMFEYLKKQFQNHQIKKNYQTLVEGIIEKDSGKITTPLKKNKQNIMIARTDKNAQGTKTAVTEFMVLQRFKHYTLLEIIIKTGRTHQVRAHLKSIGHPIIGDELYKTTTHKASILKQRNRNRQKLNRIFLHAHKLGFYDLESNWCEFKSELPKELTEFLKQIK